MDRINKMPCPNYLTQALVTIRILSNQWRRLCSPSEISITFPSQHVTRLVFRNPPWWNMTFSQPSYRETWVSATVARLWPHWFCVGVRGIWGTFCIHVISCKRRTVSHCGGFQFLRCHPNFIASNRQRIGTQGNRVSRDESYATRCRVCVINSWNPGRYFNRFNLPPPSRTFPALNITSYDSVDWNQISYCSVIHLLVSG